VSQEEAVSAAHPHANAYANVVVGAELNPLMPTPDAIDEEFATGANAVLARAAELIRAVASAHQGTAAVMVDGDWSTIRKSFSLSEKYAAWAHYGTPATGYGIHGWMREHRAPVRLTQAELEAHPQWRGFGREAGQHPPMRGWLAAPLIDSAGTVWGLVQASDRYEGEFTADDEADVVRLAALVALSLEALWSVRNLRKQLEQQVDTPLTPLGKTGSDST
jgi:GAF domain-containing protein